MTELHHQIVECFLFALGAAAGSFLNVCVCRLPARQSLCRPRSRCPGCNTPIAARHNIPILGWLVLLGRCRACRMRISLRYPAVELTTGLMFVSVYWIQIVRSQLDPLEAGFVGYAFWFALFATADCALLTLALIGWDAYTSRRYSAVRTEPGVP
jgi:leader peptidase (prepilin peptidase)/N-methyltransferase